MIKSEHTDLLLIAKPSPGQPRNYYKGHMVRSKRHCLPGSRFLLLFCSFNGIPRLQEVLVRQCKIRETSILLINTISITTIKIGPPK